jgi:hypothetical protein
LAYLGGRLSPHCEAPCDLFKSDQSLTIPWKYEMALGAHRDWSALAGKEGVGADDQFAGTYMARAVSGWPVPSSLGLADSNCLICRRC